MIVQFSNLDPQFGQDGTLLSSASASRSVRTQGASLDASGSDGPQAPQNRWLNRAE